MKGFYKDREYPMFYLYKSLYYSDISGYHSYTFTVDKYGSREELINRGVNLDKIKSEGVNK